MLGSRKSELKRTPANTDYLSQSHLLLSQWNCEMLPLGNPIDRYEEQDRCPPGNAGPNGPQNHRDSWTVARVAKRIEQISGDLLAVNRGTLYPVLLKLEQEGSIASEWGASDNNRKARFYRLTREGSKHLQAEARGWEQTAEMIGKFFAAKAEDLQ
jgi:PadR family transcriptional regulator, regulatory protein PadR